MRYKPVLRAIGMLMIGEALMLIPSFAVASYYREGDSGAFLITIILLLLFGLPLTLMIDSKVRGLYPREGIVIAGLGWILLALFGMLPFIFSGAIRSPADAFFETVSGFTTTGASILTHVEGLPHGILFWRSFTNWVGGMGVLVLTIAMLPQLKLRNMELLRAESPGPMPEKLVPRIRETAKMLYFIYLGLSALMFVTLLIAGNPVYDAVINTFGAAGTGGFSHLNASIGTYNNPVIEMIIAVFMLMFGVNFSVYFAVLVRQWRKALKNQEVLLYFTIVLAAVALITLDILPRFTNIGESLRYSLFQVSSIITTTGYSSTDFNLWPTFSKCILLCLMIVGACAGSTGGGVKVVRVLLSVKLFRREMQNLLHPRSVRTVTMDGKPVGDVTLRSVLIFIFTYFIIMFAATLIVALDGFDFTTTLTSVITTISNIGPGLGLVGPFGNFHAFSVLSKLTLSFCMLAGRLEIMPVLMLFFPSLWRRT